MGSHKKKDQAIAVTINTVSLHATGNSNACSSNILNSYQSIDQWLNDIPTLVDLGGCESGINARFAYTNNFQIFKDATRKCFL